ncbi:MAG: beta-lactamase family protein [Planctomycetes bacterium]|nr:beta-lactamase family protein [Planctomycetota bacterium]
MKPIQLAAAFALLTLFDTFAPACAGPERVERGPVALRDHDRALRDTREHDRAPRDLHALVARVRERSGLPALGAALVTSSGLEAVGVAGLRSAASSAPVTIDDRWHLGSCTKTITATLAARLIERGALRWDTTIGSVFGSAIHPGWKDVTLEQLLCHRSGAPLNFSEDAWERMVARGGSLRAQRRFFVDEGLKSAPSTPPNTATVYSNSGYLVAGAMLEERADAAWEELVRREVFEPLGLRHTGFGAPGTAGRLDQPFGHVRGADGWTPVEFGPNADNPAATGPAGTVHATLGDWARFVAAHLAGERGDATFLAPATWKRLHTASGSDWGTTPGWMQAEAEWASGPALRHMGSNGFWIAEATLAPGKDVAVLLVTNVSDDAVEAPFRELLELFVAEHAAAAR